MLAGSMVDDRYRNAMPGEQALHFYKWFDSLHLTRACAVRVGGGHHHEHPTWSRQTGRGRGVLGRGGLPRGVLGRGGLPCDDSKEIPCGRAARHRKYRPALWVFPIHMAPFAQRPLGGVWELSQIPALAFRALHEAQGGGRGGRMDRGQRRFHDFCFPLPFPPGRY